MSIAQEIGDLQKARNATMDAMTALSEKAAAAERVFTPDEEATWQRDVAAVDAIDRRQVLLRGAEQQTAATARPAESPLGSSLAMPERRGDKRFPGQGFTRFVCAVAMAKGNLPQAVEIAQRWTDQPEIANVLRAASRLGGTNDEFWLGRAAVTPGTTQDPVWAAPLANYQVMASEFIELLRPVTILGRLPALSKVPFMVKIPRQTAGATANWVGEGLSKPVSKLAFDLVTIPYAKTATIVVITQELARFSTPSAEMLVRDDLVKAIAQFLDVQFIDRTITPIAGLRPGSITNTAPVTPSTGSTVASVVADLNLALLNLMTATQGNISSAAWIMSPSAALFLSTLRTSLDVFVFPSMAGATAGTLGPTPYLLGLPVVVSGNVALAGGLSDIILVDQAEILLADDGQVTIDASTEASLQMDSAPATPPTPLISLWQQNMLGIKAERFIYWMARRAGVVQVITGFPAAGGAAAAAEGAVERRGR